METNVEEALRAKDNAEKLFAVKDFIGAKNHALRAQMLYPHLEGVAHMVATFEIYAASEAKINGEIDLYSVLGSHPSAERSVLKKQYRKLAVLLHPDKNKTLGADGAFRVVSEAWNLLSDNRKRYEYDLRRNKHLSSVYGAGVSDSDSSSRLDTFWTVCTSCNIQYEYLRKYVNKRLSCKNCRGVFVAVETGNTPVAYCPWSYASENEYANSTFSHASRVPSSGVGFMENGTSACRSGHGSENSHHMSFQWNSYTGPSDNYTKPVNLVHRVNGNINRSKANDSCSVRNSRVKEGSNGYNVAWAPRRGRPPKKPRIEEEEMASRTEHNAAINSNGTATNHGPDLSNPWEASVKRYSSAPAFDARKLLIDKARTVILKKLEEMKLASALEAERREKLRAEVVKFGASHQTAATDCHERQLVLEKTGSIPITVPDSDFHDFDQDRSEDCFKPKQIWALYDEEDGMPRLYCLIRQVISVKPFQIHISYLNSKTDSEFGPVNWIDSGFTKSCGSFRVFHSEMVDQVNIFSHLLSREKAGRGGCVRIYPKSGDIWAVYRNWTSDWNRRTPKEVRHQYEMVEVLDDYSEELGVCVTPLIKIDGYKTVYKRNSNKTAIRWIPRREMLRFSHQVPSCLLKGELFNLPDAYWDLDPAATPEGLLQTAMEVDEEKKMNPGQISASTELHAHAVDDAEAGRLENQVQRHTATPAELVEAIFGVETDEKLNAVQ